MISAIRAKIQKLPKMEEMMNLLAKSIERLNDQGDNQQRSSKEMKKLLSNLLIEIAHSRF